MEQPSAGDAVAQWIRRNAATLGLAVALILFVLPRLSPFDGLNTHLDFARRVSEWSLRHLERLFQDYGYYVVFIGVLLENSMFLGLLVPGAIILILAGLAAENGTINIWYVFALAITATVIGDTVSYMIGRLGWTRVLERTGFGKLVERVREPMESNSTWLILGYHLAGYSRVVGPAAAGMFRIPYRKWAPLDYAGGTIWVLLYTLLGVILGLAGVEFGDTKRTVQLLEWFFLAVFVVVIGVTYARSAAQRRRRGPPGAPPSGGMHASPVIIPVEKDD